MPLKLSPIPYNNLNARQKENYNFLKVAAALTDYGFMTLRPSKEVAAEAEKPAAQAKKIKRPAQTV